MMKFSCLLAYSYIVYLYHPLQCYHALESSISLRFSNISPTMLLTWYTYWGTALSLKLPGIRNEGNSCHSLALVNNYNPALCVYIMKEARQPPSSTFVFTHVVNTRLTSRQRAYSLRRSKPAPQMTSTRIDYSRLKFELFFMKTSAMAPFATR